MYVFRGVDGREGRGNGEEIGMKGSRKPRCEELRVWRVWR